MEKEASPPGRYLLSQRGFTLYWPARFAAGTSGQELVVPGRGVESRIIVQLELPPADAAILATPYLGEPAAEDVIKVVEHELAVRLDWRRRLGLALRYELRTPAAAVSPGVKLKRIGLERLGRDARYMTHIAPVGRILDKSYYLAYAACVVPLDPGPVMTGAEWTRLLGKERVGENSNPAQLYGMCEVLPGLETREVAERAMLMATLPAFAPHIRSVYVKSDVELNDLIPFLSTEGRRQLAFDPLQPELDKIARLMEDGPSEQKVSLSIVACIVLALLGFDAAADLNGLTDEQADAHWASAASWLDARTSPETM